MTFRKEWKYATQYKNKTELENEYEKLRTEYFDIVTKLDQYWPLISALSNFVNEKVEFPDYER